MNTISLRGWVIAALIIVAHAGALLYMGQPALCECGVIKLWHGVVISAENSQHLTDWYTLSHVIHGVLFYALLALVFPRLSMSLRLIMALVLESGWELFENTDFVINRYREQALAQGYSGDSVVNSVGDMFSVLAGFLIARRAPLVVSIVFVIMLELIALYAIRDNLTLNIIQLIHPIDAIGAWQSGR